MITKTDLLNHTRMLVRQFILPTILRSTIWAVAGGVVFFFAGAMVYWFGFASLLNGWTLVLKLLVALIVIVIYVVLGIVAGLVFGGHIRYAAEATRSSGGDSRCSFSR